MRPHTHTHDVRHTRLPLSPRTSKPKSKLRVKRVCPACCAECVTAPARGRPGVRSGRRTRHTTRTATDPSQTATQTQTRRADTRTQTRRRAPRTKQGTTARCGSVPASFATASLATYMPWYCPPRLLDLQLPRRRQTSSDVDFREKLLFIERHAEGNYKTKHAKTARFYYTTIHIHVPTYTDTHV